MSPEAVARLDKIFRDVFELDAGRDVTPLSQKNVKRWDSMGLMTLVLAIESEFKLTIDMNDTERLTSYAAVRDYLEGKIT